MAETTGHMSETDLLFEAARGDPHVFAEWMGRVERPIRASLRRFSRVVDVEVVMQETLLRMWLVACDRTRAIQGENASLRFALGVARNVALEEVRRARLGRLVSIDDMNTPPEPATIEEPPPDPGLRRAIVRCMDALPKRLGQVIRARLQHGHAQPDRDLAAGLGMKLNAFLQCVVRARVALARCLESHGVELEGFTR